MRILHVTGGLPIGGSQLMVTALARGCAAAGHEVTVWNLGATGPYERELLTAGVTVVSLRHSGRGRPLAAVVLVTMMARMALGRWDVVHSHLSVSAMFSIASAINRRVVWVTTYHGWLTTSWRRHLARLLSVLQSGTIAVSSGVRTHLTRDCGVAQHRITVIHNGISPSERPQSSPRRAPGTTLGCVGRIAPHKGQVILAKAFMQVAERHPEARLVFVGDGPDRERLDSVTQALQVAGRVAILGERRDGAELIEAMDLLVVPSLFEGFSLTALEAMRGAVAVLATDAGGTPEVIEEGVTGYLFRAGDEVALAAAIDRALCDDLVALGLAGRERYLRLFTEDRMLKQHLEYYEELLGISR